MIKVCEIFVKQRETVKTYKREIWLKICFNDHQWLTGKNPKNAPNIQHLFAECIRNLNQFCIAECIYDWKFGNNGKENKHRNIHVVIVDQDASKLQELLSIMSKDENSAFKIETFEATIKKNKGKKIAFEFTQNKNKILSCSPCDKQTGKKSKRKKKAVVTDKPLTE